MSSIFTLRKGSEEFRRFLKILRGIVVAEGYTPEDHVEEEEDHQVDDPPKIVDLVSFNPVRVPARVLAEGVDLLTRLLLPFLVSVLDKSQFWVDGLGLSAE